MDSDSSLDDLLAGDDELAQESDAPQTSPSEEPAISQDPASEPDDSVEHTEDTTEIKDLDPLDAWMAEVAQLLKQQEALKLAYVNGNIPTPYFDNWVAECNEHFALLTRLAGRKRRMKESA